MPSRVDPDNDRTEGQRATDGSPQRPRAVPFMSLGVLIGIGAGLGIVVGALIGEPALGLICGAGLGTVSGAVLETMRRR